MVIAVLFRLPEEIPTQDMHDHGTFSDLVHPMTEGLFDALAGQLTGNLYEAPYLIVCAGRRGWEWFEGSLLMWGNCQICRSVL